MNKQTYDKIKVFKTPITNHDNYSISGYYGNSHIITIGKTNGEWSVKQQMDGATILNNEQMTSIESTEIIALVKVRAFNFMRDNETLDQVAAC